MKHFPLVMLGLLVAFAGVFLTQLTGRLYFDGTASILIGAILVGTAVWLPHETKGLLIGESANHPVINAIVIISPENPACVWRQRRLSLRARPHCPQLMK